MRVLADGCFDPLHVGHVQYLHAADAYGQPLIVRIAPDADITAKGRTPFQTREERAQTILALGVVDRVVLHATLAAAVRDLTPQYLVKGADWRGRLPADVQAACQDVGTAIVYVDTQARTCSERLRA